MVFDAFGKLSYQSSRARELSFYALAQRDSSDHWQEGLGMEQIQAAIASLFVEVKRAVDAHRAGFGPPAWTLSNAWGEFQLRAYELQQDGSNAQSFGVLLERKTPIEVRLLQRVKSLSLSNRQREVCYLVARGVPSVDIAHMLNISATTLKEHTQTIYRKLNVKNREDLVRLILR